MRKMKKYVYALTTAVLAIGMLLGCSKKGDITPEEKHHKIESTDLNLFLGSYSGTSDCFVYDSDGEFIDEETYIFEECSVNVSSEITNPKLWRIKITDEEHKNIEFSINIDEFKEDLSWDIPSYEMEVKASSVTADFMVKDIFIRFSDHTNSSLSDTKGYSFSCFVNYEQEENDILQYSVSVSKSINGGQINM